MSTIADPFCHELAHHLAAHLERPVDFVEEIPYDERERLLEIGEIQLGWICGLLYVEKVRTLDFACAPVAAPVMQKERYRGAPVYFADLIVHRGSPYHTWADLRGATWTYNEASSYSGFHMLLAHMERQGQSRTYFGREIVSGSHLESIRLVRQGIADVAAIDSTVLDAAVHVDPQVANDLRVVTSVGPRPMPPWVLSTRIEADVRKKVQHLLTSLHLDAAGATLLARAQMVRLVAVDHRSYDPVRKDTAYKEGLKNVAIDKALNAL